MRMLLFVIYAFCLCMQRVHCELTAKTDHRIDGDCTFLLKEIKSASECACYLKDNAELMAAVSFDFSTKRCIGATRDSDFAIITASRWITFESNVDVEKNQTVPEQPKGKQVFTVSAEWTVPRGVYSFTGLCIGGGGGGGYYGAFGGGGSGWIAYDKVSAEAGTVVRVQIGGGGHYTGTNGGNSSIGNWILATGGIGGASSAAGARGGSGGGGGSTQLYMTGGKGGDGGGDGFPASNGPSGGNGQGKEVWLAAVAAMTQFNITFGAGGLGGGSTGAGAGGGGGGILVDNFKTGATSGTIYEGAGGGGSGYGAGGGGAGCNSKSCSGNGGYGAPGLCIIQW